MKSDKERQNSITEHTADRNQVIVNSFYDELNHIPELKKGLNWLKEEPKRAGEIISQYENILDTLTNYTEDDAKIVAQARRKMSDDQVDTTSAAHVKTADFIRNLTPEKSQNLRNSVRNAFGPGVEHYIPTLKRLSQKMYRAHQLASESVNKPKDGDPVWDEVIWTHTQLHPDTDPATVAHVFLAHYLAQYFIHEYPEDMQEKDDFLEYLTDTILLEEARNPGSSGVIEKWITTKAEKGLGWVSTEQLNAYKEVVGKQAIK